MVQGTNLMSEIASKDETKLRGPDSPASLQSFTELAVRNNTALISLSDCACQGHRLTDDAREHLAARVGALKLSKVPEVVFDLSKLDRLDAETMSVIVNASHPDLKGTNPNKRCSVSILGANESVHESLVRYGFTSANSPIKVLAEDAVASIRAKFDGAPSAIDIQASNQIGASAEALMQQKALERLTMTLGLQTLPEQKIEGPILAIDMLDNAFRITPVVNRIGEQTSASRMFHDEVRDALARMQLIGAKHLILDCKNIEGSLGADAVGTIISCAQTLQGHNATLELRNIPEALGEQLRMTRLDGFLSTVAKKAA